MVPAMNGWHVIQVSVGRELEVSSKLDKDDIASHVPVLHARLPHRRHRRSFVTKTIVPVPGYVFVESAWENWEEFYLKVKAARGVHRFLVYPGSDMPVTISEKEYRKFCLKLDETRMADKKSSAYARFDVGATVKVVQGAFRGLLATVVGYDRLTPLVEFRDNKSIRSFVIPSEMLREERLA